MRKETLSRAPYTPLKKLASYLPSLWASATALGGCLGRSLQFSSFVSWWWPHTMARPASAPVVDEPADDGHARQADLHIEVGRHLVCRRSKPRTLCQ
jgi:hypothetical protein